MEAWELLGIGDGQVRGTGQISQEHKRSGGLSPVAFQQLEVWQRRPKGVNMLGREQNKQGEEESDYTLGPGWPDLPVLALLSYGGEGKPFLQPPAAAMGKSEFHGR